jgi:hypothetical protein
MIDILSDVEQKNFGTDLIPHHHSQISVATRARSETAHPFRSAVFENDMIVLFNLRPPALVFPVLT